MSKLQTLSNWVRTNIGVPPMTKLMMPRKKWTAPHIWSRGLTIADHANDQQTKAVLKHAIVILNEWRCLAFLVIINKISLFCGAEVENMCWIIPRSRSGSMEEAMWQIFYKSLLSLPLLPFAFSLSLFLLFWLIQCEFGHPYIFIARHHFGLMLSQVKNLNFDFSLAVFSICHVAHWWLWPAPVSSLQ